MWIVRLALRRPYTIAVISALILIFGAMSATRMKVDILPAIDIPVVIVVWNYNGLSAEDMERRIVLLSERAYSTTVDGISHIESESIEGVGILKVYFEPDADIGAAIAQIASVSQTASKSMPPGISPPNILRYNASNVPVAQLTVASPSLSEQQLYDYGLNFIRVKLFTVPGISIPAPYGGKARQIMVDIDPRSTAAKGLTPNDVVQAVLQSNVLVPAGAARIGNTQYDITLNSAPTTVDAFNQLPVKVVDGAPVYLGSVAKVHDGYAVQQNVVHVNGKRATYLTLLKHSNASTLAVVDATRDLLPDIKAAAPGGMELKIDFDQSVFVRAAIKNVLHEALISSILVSLMILFFLGSWRSMVIVSTSIPLSILVGIAGLFLFGHTFNIMTLGGLALAIGMLVDDATVAIENIHRNRTLGRALTPAILHGSDQIAVPALAATLTICIVFFPVVMLTGPAKYLFTPLAIAVVVAMLASYVLSRTLVPMLARQLLGAEEHDPAAPPHGLWGHFNHWRDAAFERFQNAYGRVLESVLAHRGYVLGCGALVLAVTATLPFLVGMDFFPSVDSGQMRLHFRAPIGTKLEETEKMVLQAEERIREIIPADELETINDNIGIPIFYNLAFVSTDNIGGQDAEILIALKPNHHPTESYMRRIREELPHDFPGSSLYFQPADIVSQVLNFGVSAPIDVQIEGNNLEQSYELARKLRDEVRKIPGATDVRIAQVLNYPSLNVDVDRFRAAQAGITERDVANNLLTTLSSSSIVSPSFWLNPQNNVNYIVAVQTPLPQMSSTADLMNTPLSGTPGLRELSARTPVGGVAQGTSVALSTVATLRPGNGKALINHSTVQRVIDLQASAEGRDLGSVSGDIQKVIDQLKLPAATHIRIRGQSESMVSSFKSLGLGLLLAIALVYLLMVVLFQSWLDPFIIMVAVPGALCGILWMLAVTHTTLNVESFMGSIMAVGIAVSNSILLVTFANEVRVEKGLNALEAALEAGKARLRPVLMTALAMVIGMVPMALALGEGGEQNAPLGRAVIGGLCLATFVTLFLVPVVYSLLRQKPPQQHELDQRFEAESREGDLPLHPAH